MERRKKRKTSQSTLLHGGDVGCGGMCYSGSWGYVRKTKNFFTFEVAKEFQNDFMHSAVVS